MGWALVNEHLWAAAVSEPLFQHFGVHVRCLVAIPLLIAAEAVAEAVSRRLFPHFVASGFVIDATKPRFIEILRGAARLRDSWTAAAVMVALAVLLAWRFTGVGAVQDDALAWAVSRDVDLPRLGFGGWWFLCVVRPVFTFFLLQWVWRLCLASVVFWRITRLELQLVPTHPDRAGGLGFLERMPVAFSLVVLAALVTTSFTLVRSELDRVWQTST